MKKAEYMQRRIGNVYQGMVSGVQKWGFYVELDNSVEGLVDSDFLYDNGYYYDEIKSAWRRTKDEIFQIGTICMVKVINASKKHGTIDFILEESDEQE